MFGQVARSLVLVLFAVALSACDRGPTKSEAAPVVTTSTPTATTTARPAVAPAGDTFGAGVTLAAADAVKVDAVLADPAAYKGKTVRVEGMITDVCPKRGCWFEMAGEQPGHKLRFKVTDGEMVFPPDAKGKWAVAQGVVAVRELTLEQTKEHAEYQSKEYGIKYDPASVTKPTSIVKIDGTGAIIADKK